MESIFDIPPVKPYIGPERVTMIRAIGGPLHGRMMRIEDGPPQQIPRGAGVSAKYSLKEYGVGGNYYQFFVLDGLSASDVERLAMAELSSAAEIT